MPRWTDAQARAIYEPSGKGNILVSAAAGSGKTAVLVERIADMITRDENPIPIDRLLIVTFTEAASAEMKERIISRINEAYHEAIQRGDSTKSRFLREQMHLTVSADINTIDAFCLRVVKNNFHILGIDPNFSIMDKHEGEMLMDDTLSELFDALYASDEEKERFTRLVSVYASNRDDEGLKNVIRKIYNFMNSFAEPEKWLLEKADMYSCDMTESVWLRKIVLEDKKNDIINRNGSFWDDIAAQMLDIAEKKYGVTLEGERDEIPECEQYWGKLWKNVCMCKKAVNALRAAECWEDFTDFYKTYIEKKSYLGTAMNKIPAKKDADDNEWQSFYNKYDDMRNFLRNECLKLIKHDREEFNQYVHAEELKQSVDDLVWLTLKFSEEFEKKKDRKNEKSFSDVEHLAYRLFAENENIRMEYADRYEEILIDEYQDTNGLQDAIFASISRDGQNEFMVGDLKQSIYRFRGGDPTIFKEKSRSFSEESSNNTRIVLTQNFRSRRGVLDSINNLFGAVMSDEVGDVDYNDDEALRRDADKECYIDGDNLMHPSNREIGYNSELHRIAVITGDDETDEDVTTDRAEAACAADRIRHMVDSRFQVYDGKGGYRDIEYRDIVILMRSVKSGGDTVHSLLESRGIPAFVQKEEYFERREIRLMLALISVINNHMQDIPLLAVMRSPIGGFTENELALIKADYTGRTFYKAVKSYKSGCDSMTEKEEKLRKKCRRFVNNLNRWRGYVKTKSIASFIWTLYEETGFYDFMGALEGGEEAQANLKLLYERAQRYESSGFKGIFNFIRYIERMDSRNDDISGANLVSENHNVVKIMTIHKSKGLEFPVVFLMKTAKKLAGGRAVGDGRVLLHKDLGIGVDYYNYENMYCKKLLFNEYIKEANDREGLSEEMRLMYVAMTRAKEKLIVTAAHTYKNREEYENKIQQWHDGYYHTRLSKRVAERAKSYADWIIPAVLSNGGCWDLIDTEVSSLAYETEEEVQREEIVLDDPDKLRESIYKILEFSYSYPDSGAIPAKTSVTAIKEMSDEEHERDDNPVYMTQKPKFMRAEKLGAEIGTAHHQVMAYINIEKMRGISGEEYEDFVAEETARIAADGQIRPDIAQDEKIVKMICDNVCGFFRSDMGKAVLSSQRVYRERPFEIEIPVCEYSSSVSGGDDMIVVQGIIDLYFEDSEGNLILVDYKTDRCKTEEERRAVAERYTKQIELYGRAIEKILKKSVKDKYLYLFSAQSVVKL